MEAIEKRCLELFARDYKYSIIDNSNGEVCGHYPRQIVFLEYQCTDVEKDRYPPVPLSPTIALRFKVQSTRLPIVCLRPSSNHAQLTGGQGAKVTLHLPAAVITSERRGCEGGRVSHMRSHCSRMWEKRCRSAGGFVLNFARRRPAACQMLATMHFQFSRLKDG